MKDYKIFSRAAFVRARYVNFRKKRFALRGVPKELYHMTDLDKVYAGQVKKQRDIVLCDRCQADIEDPNFVMLENSFVYHRNCVRDELPVEIQEEPQVDMSNVFVLDDFRAKIE